MYFWHKQINYTPFVKRGEINTMKFYYYRALIVLVLGVTTNAAAVDVSLSGFGTIGYVQSDQSHNYLKYINNKGTLKADSLFGAQLDAKFNEHWGATYQLVAAPVYDYSHNSELESRTRWAFLSYRPDNDWLVRLGKQRVGSFVNMQNMEVGTTYDMARLPAEVYWIAPTYDFTGISIAKTWHLDTYDASLEGVYGVSDASLGSFLAGSNVHISVPISFEVKGVGLSLSSDDDSYRLGYYSTDSKMTGSADQVAISRVDIQATPFGDLVTPTTVREAGVSVLLASASFVRGNYRLSTEYAMASYNGVENFLPNRHGAYLSLSRKLGNWTPYITYSKAWSSGVAVDNYYKLKSAVAPLGYENAYKDLLSQTQFHDQSAWMLGTAYSISPKQKIKAEVMQVRTGERSSLYDNDASNQEVIVYSLSYNFAF
jgi:hypothetical protein